MHPNTNVDTLTATLRYLRRGFSIVPLVPRTKRPAVTLAPYLSGEKRMTEDEARAYWSAHPEAGVAIITGAPSGLVAIDVDPRSGGDCEATARDCPTDLAAQTGGGGLHLLCRHPGGRVPSGKTGRRGVDRKGDGGYIVAAPSIHPDTGERYVWLREGEPGELPAWAVEKPVPPAVAPQGEATEPWVARTIASPEACVPGTQDETLTRLAWWAAGHLPEDIALAILASWIEKLPLSKPHEPWTQEHVKAKLTSAYAKREPAFVVQGEGSEARGGSSRRDSRSLSMRMRQSVSEFSVDPPC